MTFDPEVYGEPVYSDVLWDTEVYGEGDVAVAGAGELTGSSVGTSAAVGLLTTVIKLAGSAAGTSAAAGILGLSSIGRLSQEPVEVAVSPTSQTARTDQLPVEVLMLVILAARIDQLPVEVLMLVILAARIDQLPIEVAINPNAPARLDQLPIEVAINPNAPAAFAQSPIEVLMLPDAAVPARTRIVWVGG